MHLPSQKRLAPRSRWTYTSPTRPSGPLSQPQSLVTPLGPFFYPRSSSAGSTPGSIRSPSPTGGGEPPYRFTVFRLDARLHRPPVAPRSVSFDSTGSSGHPEQHPASPPITRQSPAGQPASNHRNNHLSNHPATPIPRGEYPAGQPRDNHRANHRTNRGITTGPTSGQPPTPARRSAPPTVN